MIICNECEYGVAKCYKGDGRAKSAGRTPIIKYTMCNHPQVKHTMQSLKFMGHTSPRNCPFRPNNKKGDKKL